MRGIDIPWNRRYPFAPRLWHAVDRVASDACIDDPAERSRFFLSAKLNSPGQTLFRDPLRPPTRSSPDRRRVVTLYPANRSFLPRSIHRSFLLESRRSAFNASPSLPRSILFRQGRVTAISARDPSSMTGRALGNAGRGHVQSRR